MCASKCRRRLVVCLDVRPMSRRHSLARRSLPIVTGDDEQRSACTRIPGNTARRRDGDNEIVASSKQRENNRERML